MSILCNRAGLLIKTIVLLATYVALFSNSADARPSTRTFTCEGVRDFIATRGAVVMNTNSPFIYRRFVVHGGFCQSGEGISLYSAPTKDGKCRLKICVDIDYEDMPWHRR